SSTEIYTLSLHDALPILRFMLSGERCRSSMKKTMLRPRTDGGITGAFVGAASGSLRVTSCASLALPAVMRSKKLIGRGLPSTVRSEEHTSELQSRGHLVC